jgi:hypothetical protein
VSENDASFDRFSISFSTEVPEESEAVSGDRYARTGQSFSEMPKVEIVGFLLWVPLPARRHPIKRLKARRFNKRQKFTVITK